MKHRERYGSHVEHQATHSTRMSNILKNTFQCSHLLVKIGNYIQHIVVCLGVTREKKN